MSKNKIVYQNWIVELGYDPNLKNELNDLYNGLTAYSQESVQFPRNFRYPLRTSRISLTQNQLDKTRSGSIKDRKELNEITASLYEKMVQLESLEASRRRLLEQKTSLEVQIAGGGLIVAEPVTPDFDPVRSSSMPGELDIKGLITEVGKTLTVISVGSADGVRKGMVFHVTRGDDFICDIVITEVDTNQSAGVLDLVQQQPRTRDVVSTRL